jgi:hypothetical protein
MSIYVSIKQKCLRIIGVLPSNESRDTEIQRFYKGNVRELI